MYLSRGSCDSSPPNAVAREGSVSHQLVDNGIRKIPAFDKNITISLFDDLYTMIDWKNYYYTEFPDVLRTYSQTRKPKHHCPHCKAPAERRCLVDKDIQHEPYQFRFAWFGITLFDQGLFTYFPEASKRWVRATGGYPLPVEQSGFGCVRVAAPSRLLTKYDRLLDWQVYVAFWLEETEQFFEHMTGIVPQEFFNGIQHDKDFKGQSPFLEHLLNAAEGRFLLS